MGYLIGLTGKAGSGKDTVADGLVKSNGYRKIAFADVLKDMICALLSVTREKIEDRRFKEFHHPLFIINWCY